MDNNKKITMDFSHIYKLFVSYRFNSIFLFYFYYFIFSFLHLSPIYSFSYFYLSTLLFSPILFGPLPDLFKLPQSTTQLESDNRKHELQQSIRKSARPWYSERAGEIIKNEKVECSVTISSKKISNSRKVTLSIIRLFLFFPYFSIFYSIF